MNIKTLFNKLKPYVDNNINMNISISTKNETIKNEYNNFENSHRIENIYVSDIIFKNNNCIILHKEDVVGISRDNEYVFLVWRCNEYEKLRKRLLSLLNDDTFSNDQKNKIMTILIEDKFDYSKYVNIESFK